MSAARPVHRDVPAYIAAQPPRVRAMLRQVRSLIRKAAPDARETISYRIPAYMLHGPLVYFAAFPDHISLYPAPRGVPEFQRELAAYKGGKGTVQFPLDKPLPLGLIARIVRYRVKENKARAAQRGKR